MAIKQTGQKWNPILVTTKRKFIIDNEQDVVDLPTCCPGSYALCVDGGIVYMVNASGEWKKMGAAAFSPAEGVLF